MDIEGVHKFFNLGFSDKSIDKIGEKGIGTKIFYKSDSINLETQNKDGVLLIANMMKPWEKLQNNQVPEYEIEESKGNEKRGTKIIITSYKVDNPERFFNLESIKDYIQ